MPKQPATNRPSPDDSATADSMRTADITNGENPDDSTNMPPKAGPTSSGRRSHRTGERQAAINRDNDPPA